MFQPFKVGLHISTAATLIFPVRKTICPFVDYKLKGSDSTVSYDKAAVAEEQTSKAVYHAQKNLPEKPTSQGVPLSESEGPHKEDLK